MRKIENINDYTIVVGTKRYKPVAMLEGTNNMFASYHDGNKIRLVSDSTALIRTRKEGDFSE